ncbi:MAG TPA: MerR family transcriptional regulator [Candidatus Limnocylindria bacterium]|nr:MerR family transcriptional regulator [Candidatus Limnocylindria bacterium]
MPDTATKSPIAAASTSPAPAAGSLAAPPADAADAPADALPDEQLLRIQEVADLVGLTSRSIRYYEEVGLLEPAARSEGAYRLYDPDDVARLQFIKGLRDDAGFSLAEIGQLLEDETARAANRTRFRESRTIADRRAVLRDGIERIDRQVATLQAKIERLRSMVGAAGTRRTHLERHLAELDALPEDAPPPPPKHRP